MNIVVGSKKNWQEGLSVAIDTSSPLEPNNGDEDVSPQSNKQLARRSFYCLCRELPPDTSDIIVVVQVFLLYGNRVAKMHFQ